MKAALVVLLCVLWVQTPVWSDNFNAYTLVTLSTLDGDDALYAAFYHGKAGTVLHVWPDGVASLSMLSRRGATQVSPTASITTTPHADTTTELLPRVPYRARLSDEWVLLEHCPNWASRASHDPMDVGTRGHDSNAQRHQHEQQEDEYTNQRHASQSNQTNSPLRARRAVTHTCGSADSDRHVTLLHCRLPLPHNVTRVMQARQAYLDTHEAGMSEAIASWWQRVGHGRSSGCLYGDGEGAFTQTPRYYMVCPQGSIYRVHHVYLYWLMQQDELRQTEWGTGHPATAQSKRNGGPRTTDAVNKEVEEAATTTRRSTNAATVAKGGGGGGGVPRAAPDDFVFGPLGKRRVMRFLEQMHRSPSHHRRTLHSEAFAEAFEPIGQYDAHASRPVWNKELLVWQMRYPSAQRCYEDDGVPAHRRASAEPAAPSKQTRHAVSLVQRVRVMMGRTVYWVRSQVAPRRWPRVQHRSDRASVHMSHRRAPSSPPPPVSKPKNFSTWQTVVRIRCADTVPDDMESTSTAAHISRRSGRQRQPQRRRVAGTVRDTDEAVHYWSITEVRQTCVYEVEISTPFVCDWDDVLDSFSVNPIPCAQLD